MVTRSHTRWSTALGAILSLAAVSDALAQSCAMCASSFGVNDPVTKAFNWSIIFLMAAPYTLVATVGGWLFFTYRRAAGRSRASVTRLPLASRPSAPVEVPEEV
jgi:hypothetical protein